MNEQVCLGVPIKVDVKCIRFYADYVKHCKLLRIMNIIIEMYLYCYDNSMNIGYVEIVPGYL